MRKFKGFLFFFFFVFSVTVAWAQEQMTVKGKVTDGADNSTLPGVNVVVKETLQGVSTDINGEYTITVKKGNTLLFSFVGMKPVEVKVGDEPVINVTLKADAQLDEVVVIGYGTTRKRDLTGAVSSVKMKDEPLSTVSTVSHLLAGKAAGFQVNTVSAQPGGAASFRIRGAASSEAAGNEPLIIIDGFPVSEQGSIDMKNKYRDGKKDNVLATINPNDIESIEILKDASSTAIYGARAGNGVIIITTKHGRTGAPKVTYSGSVSVQKIAKSYDMLDAAGFTEISKRYEKEMWMIDNKVGIYGGKTESEVGPFQSQLPADADSGNDTDWFDLVTRVGYQTSHNLSMTGGTEKTQYMASLNYFKQEGIIKDNGMERFSVRVNLDQKIGKFMKTGVNLTMSRNNYDNVPLGDAGAEDAGILVSAAQFNPLLPVRKENGDYALNEAAGFLPNPVSLLEITDQTRKERLLGTIFLEAEPIQGLKLKANVGIDRNYQKRETYLPKTTLYGKTENGKAIIGQDDESDYLFELTGNYSKTLGAHSFGVLVGYSYQTFDKEGLGMANNNFLIDGFLFNNMGAGTAPRPTVQSYASKSKMASLFGRVNYSYKERYLLTATLRADGSSNFAKDNRWGYFPSVAAAWRFSEENFMKSWDNVLSNGKLRLSYGETGNANVGNKAVSFYQVNNEHNMSFGETLKKGVFLAQLGNPDLTWETTKEWNVGLDLGFFNNRVNLTAEYFYKTVSDLLSVQELLSYNEVNTIMDNVGKTQSQGVELTLNTRNIDTKDFTWTSDVTFSLYRDKWKERAPRWKPSAYESAKAPLRAWYGYRSDGLVQPGEQIAHMPGALPGQVKIKDIDGFQKDASGTIMVDKNGRQLKTGKPDGVLDDADKVCYGSKDPGYLFGFNNTLRYRNWDLNFYFYGQFNKLAAVSYQYAWINEHASDLYRGYNLPSKAKDIWAHDNQNGTIPGFAQNKSTWGAGDYFFEKTWFIRMRNITLGYTVPMKSNTISNLHLYVDVNNPFVITPYEGLDPETDDTMFAYPNVRTFSFGVDLTF